MGFETRFEINDQNELIPYVGGGSYIKFSKDSIPKWNTAPNVQNQKKIHFLVSDKLYLDENQIFGLVHVVNSIYYYNYTGVIFTVDKNYYTVISDRGEITHQSIMTIKRKLYREGYLPKRNTIYIYLGKPKSRLKSLYGKQSGNFVASNHFHINPVLLAHELGHGLGAIHFEPLIQGKLAPNTQKNLMYPQTISFADFKLFPYQSFNINLNLLKQTDPIKLSNTLFSFPSASDYEITYKIINFLFSEDDANISDNQFNAENMEKLSQFLKYHHPPSSAHYEIALKSVLDHGHGA